MKTVHPSDPWSLHMTISLTPELDRLLSERLGSGQYKSAEEVLSRALRALKEEEETITAIAEGYEDVLAGRVFTLEEANAEFHKERGLSQTNELQGPSVSSR
jgi:putative addiction module CopG family antidote